MAARESQRLLAGRYRLGAVIGRGGMGAVWRAHDELLHRDVAVKEIVWPAHLDAEEREIARRRAVREAQLAARVHHPNVVGVYDIVEEDDRPSIVMELVPFRSLRDAVAEEGPMTPAQAARVGLSVLAALRAVHEAGVVHRDVKPANILLSPEGRVVLTDFGIAKAADSPALTVSGVLLGSPSYLAPERARGGRAGAAADMWALGASLYAAVEGRPPFERDGVLASLTAVVADELEPAPHAGPLWPVIDGLLRRAPSASSAPPSPSSAPSSARSGPSATASGNGGLGTLPAGYHWFTNSTGFSIAVPRGWQISHDGHYVYIRDPDDSGIFLLIDQSDQPKADPVADWRQQAANRQGAYPGYHLILLRAVRYTQAQKAADWEFTYDRNGVMVEVLNRNILANAHHAYALYWSTPLSDWNADYHFFQVFAATFRPAPASQAG